jgi:VanZ family protein
MNTEPLPTQPINNFDKLVHTIMYLSLSGVIFFDSTRYLRFPISKKRIFLCVFLLPTAIGGLIEIMQAYFTTHRSGEWLDFIFNGVGAFFGMGIALLINRYYLLKKKTLLSAKGS